MKELASLARKWKEPTASYTPAVSSKVYERMCAPEPLRVRYLNYLVKTQYLENWLWNFFHRDSPQTEVLAIAQLVVFEPTLLRILVEDKPKLRAFLLRLSSLWEEHHALILQLMTRLVSSPSDAVPWNSMFGVHILQGMSPIPVEVSGELEASHEVLHKLGKVEQMEEKSLAKFVREAVELLHEQIPKNSEEKVHTIWFLISAISNPRSAKYTRWLVKHSGVLRWSRHGFDSYQLQELIRVTTEGAPDELCDRIGIECRKSERLSKLKWPGSAENFTKDTFGVLNDEELRELSISCGVYSEMFKVGSEREKLVMALTPLVDPTLPEIFGQGSEETATPLGFGYYGGRGLRDVLEMHFSAKCRELHNLIKQLRNSTKVDNVEFSFSPDLPVRVAKIVLTDKSDWLAGGPVVFRDDKKQVTGGGEVLSVSKKGSKVTLEVAMETYSEDVKYVTRLPQIAHRLFFLLKDLQAASESYRGEPRWLAKWLCRYDEISLPSASVFKFDTLVTNIEEALGEWDLTVDDDAEPESKKRKGGAATALRPYLVKLGDNKARITPYISLSSPKAGMKLTKEQMSVLASMLKSGVTSTEGPATDVVATAIAILRETFPGEKILVTGSSLMLNSLEVELRKRDTDALNVCEGSIEHKAALYKTGAIATTKKSTDTESLRHLLKKATEEEERDAIGDIISQFETMKVGTPERHYAIQNAGVCLIPGEQVASVRMYPFDSVFVLNGSLETPLLGVQSSTSMKRLVYASTYKIPRLYDFASVRRHSLEDMTNRYSTAPNGFTRACQFVAVNEFRGKSLQSNPANYNEAEAEYACGILKYMLEQGYSRDDIVLLAATEQQRELIREVTEFRLGETFEQVYTLAEHEGVVHKYAVVSLVSIVAVGQVDQVDQQAWLAATDGLWLLGYAGYSESEYYGTKLHSLMSDTALKIQDGRDFSGYLYQS